MGRSVPYKPPTHDPKGRTPEERLRQRRVYHDSRRATLEPWRKWYSLARWRELRAWVIRRDPACVMCKARGVIEPTTTVDHIKEHSGDPVLFWDTLNLQGLCTTCHNSVKQKQEKAARLVSNRKTNPS